MGSHGEPGNLRTTSIDHILCKVNALSLEGIENYDISPTAFTLDPSEASQVTESTPCPGAS